MEVIQSTRGKNQILLHGFAYRKEGDLVHGNESWRCTVRSCKGRIHVMPNRNVNPSLSEAKSRAAQLRQRAATSNDAPRRIILETETNLSAAAVAMMPKYRSLQRTVERKRKLAGEPIAAPQTVADIDILQRLRESLRRKIFAA